ncbi:MAG: outer membrane protein assembly factor BamD [Wolbachia endosymbiont of Menacanthus eurysternus]|nr:MAG: outer membrane protein assembly factor BamD [Wolbachia endosymbiont of Menacanthus eurysternus]
MYKALIVYFVFIICNFMQLYASTSISFEKSEIELYEKAIKIFNQKKYKQSIIMFQKVEDLYPFSYWAIKAKLLSGISNYNIGNYDSVISDMDDYIELCSDSNEEDLSYAYYLRIMSYYMQIDKLQFGQQKAYRTLELAGEYIDLFPQSEYINEIKERARIVTEHVLAKEYFIGKFYLKGGKYLAAIKRFQNVINNKNSKYFSKSIRYLIKAYLALGLDFEAQQYETLYSK